MPDQKPTLTREQTFALATTFHIVKSAVRQVSNFSEEKGDTIVFNALMEAAKKNKEGQV